MERALQDETIELRFEHNEQVHAMKSSPHYTKQKRAIGELFALYLIMIEKEFQAEARAEE